AGAAVWASISTTTTPARSAPPVGGAGGAPAAVVAASGDPAAGPGAALSAEARVLGIPRSWVLGG
ncbi:hypothetical protein, partial [Nocardia carnea]|uniref:hypothetical protein n=1 Tax=Nocardia carnea TaxID=37328 RepID=UPI0024585D83